MNSKVGVFALVVLLLIGVAFAGVIVTAPQGSVVDYMKKINANIVNGISVSVDGIIKNISLRFSSDNPFMVGKGQKFCIYYFDAPNDYLVSTKSSDDYGGEMYSARQAGGDFYVYKQKGATSNTYYTSVGSGDCLKAVSLANSQKSVSAYCAINVDSKIWSVDNGFTISCEGFNDLQFTTVKGKDGEVVTSPDGRTLNLDKGGFVGYPSENNCEFRFELIPNLANVPDVLEINSVEKCAN